MVEFHAKDLQVHRIFLRLAETPLNNSDQTLRFCTDLLLCHSVRRPPFSINLFSSEEAVRIQSYIQDHYLRHYRLYKYIFTPQVKLDLLLTYSGMAGQGPSASEDSSVPGCVVNATEDEANPTRDDSSETQEEEEAGAADLRVMVEREVRQQMQQISRQLDRRIRETASEPNSRSHAPKPDQKGNKTNRRTSSDVK